MVAIIGRCEELKRVLGLKRWKCDVKAYYINPFSSNFQRLGIFKIYAKLSTSKFF
jgi:hypothetical protein